MENKEELQISEELKENIRVLTGAVKMSMLTSEDFESFKIRVRECFSKVNTSLVDMKKETDLAALSASKLNVELWKEKYPPQVNPFYRQYKRWK